MSKEGVEHLEKWAKDEGVTVDARVADMLDLPYDDGSFDCIFAYHVVSHTDTLGFRKTLMKISRILRPGGEIYLTLCSKSTWSFKDAGYPKIDENTVVKTEEGPERGVPHFYVTLDDILKLFSDFELERIRHVDDCYIDGKRHNSKHFFILAKKPDRIF